jgi:S-DNA-T family DNA segregation ATPase FtsK/SpoIIIE
LVRLTKAVTRSAADTDCGAPHRPWRPPLPDQLPVGSLPPGPSEPRGRLAIGLVDLPDRQAQEPLELDLAEGGAWIVVGGPRSGRTTALRTILREAVHRLGPEALHVHVLESGGSALAGEALSLPHTGTAIAGEDPLRTVRLVDRLAREVTERRAGPRPTNRPSILLLIDGVEAVSDLLETADPALGASGLLRLIRDGAAVGLTCVVTADRALPGGRLAAVATQRLVLPLPDRADYAVAGIPPRAVPVSRPPGRALVGEDARECQLAMPRPDVPTWEPAAGVAPLRIAELPPDPVLPLPGEAEPSEAAGVPALVLSLGLGGDEADVLELDLLRSGGLLIAGPPASGRTAALDAFGEHLRARGAAVLRLGRNLPRPGDRTDLDWLEATDESGVQSWLAGLDGRPVVVLADDIGAPAESPALSRLPALGSGSGVVLVAAATAAELSSHYQGPVAALRRNRTALLLCPGPGDADLLGMRLPRLALPLRPGCGWLVTPRGPERIQVARRRSAEP